MGSRAVLNPQAPEFFPYQNPHLLEALLCSGATEFFPYQNPPHCVYLYNPTTFPPFLPCIESFQPSQFCNPLLTGLAVEAELSYVFDVAKELNNIPMEAYTETDQKQKEKMGVAENVDSKGIGKQRFFWEIYGCGKRREPRRAKGFKPKGKVRAEDDGCGPRTTMRFYRDSQIQVRPLENNSRASLKKKAYHPVVPVRLDGEDTTIMIRNIPNKYTREMLLDFLEKHCLVENQKGKEEKEQKNGGEYEVSAFDFMYLPMDFKSGLNKGYAFVNFTNPKAAWKFHSATNNQKWDSFQSRKMRDVAAARLQGKEKLQIHFENMMFPCESEEVLPLSFSPPRDGTIKGRQRTLGRLVKPSINKAGTGEGNGKRPPSNAATRGVSEPV